MAVTKKQATCAHPVRHVHPTIDARYETCDLCHLIRRAPIPAPWILAYDAEQPTPPPPPLFGIETDKTDKTDETDETDEK